MTPWDLISQFYQTNTNAAARDRSSADGMLLSIFAEEAARQRPYVTMPAQLALAQQDRVNAEPFAERAAQRRFKYSKSGQESSEEEGGVTTDADGNEIYVIDGKTYTVPAKKKAE